MTIGRAKSSGRALTLRSRSAPYYLNAGRAPEHDASDVQELWVKVFAKVESSIRSRNGFFASSPAEPFKAPCAEASSNVPTRSCVGSRHLAPSIACG
jgi:hypothetical protein